MTDNLPERLHCYLEKKLGFSDLRIEEFVRIPGGASRETYRFRARYMEAGAAKTRALILRRDPPASLIETDRAVEFRAYQAFHRLGLPVPGPIALDTDGGQLERPFFIMEEIENCSVASVLLSNPYGMHREKIGEQLFSILGRIAAADPDKIGIGQPRRRARRVLVARAPTMGARDQGG